MSIELGDRVTADADGFIRKAGPRDATLGYKVRKTDHYSGTVCEMKTRDGGEHLIALSDGTLLLKNYIHKLLVISKDWYERDLNQWQENFKKAVKEVVDKADDYEIEWNLINVSIEIHPRRKEA